MHLRDLGNTVIVVEHDEEAIRRADHIIDIGPGAGVHGGEVVAQGKLQDILKAKRSITGQYLSGKQKIEVPKTRRADGSVEGHSRARRARQQPEESHRRHSVRIVHVRHRRVRFRQVDADQSHADAGCGARAEQGDHADRGRARRHRRTEPRRQGRRHRPEPDRPHAALESGDVHRSVHADPRTVRANAGSAQPRLSGRPLQLQRERRPLRSVSGRRPDQGRDALPAGHLRAVRRVQEQALQPRNARRALQGQEHQRSAGDDRRGSARVLRRRADARAQAADDRRRRPVVHPARAERNDAYRGAKRNA